MAGGTSSLVQRALGLLGEPQDEVGAPVADVSADLEAARARAEVAPVAQRALGDAGSLAASWRLSISSPRFLRTPSSGFGCAVMVYSLLVDEAKRFSTSPTRCSSLPIDDQR